MPVARTFAFRIRSDADGQLGTIQAYNATNALRFWTGRPALNAEDDETPSRATAAVDGQRLTAEFVRGSV